jgi:hypothetical protein
LSEGRTCVPKQKRTHPGTDGNRADASRSKNGRVA